MKTKTLIKPIIDAALLALLLLQTAFPVTGQKLHEWLGAAMFAVFIVHNFLNLPFYKTLFKGKYNAARVMLTVLNLALWADIICLLVSGIMMSSYVFEFLHIRGGMMTARKLHLCASYRGLILMSAHLGMNWSAVFPVNKLKKNAAKSAARVAVIAVSGFGVYSFIAQNIAQCLFLRTHFVFFDYEMNKALFFAEYIAMITLFAAVFYYAAKLLKRRKEQ